jgi:hypothetical protein
MRIKLPATRKGRIWASVGTAVAVISIVGAIGDATASDDSKRYEVCMEAYHDAKHCYEDVYNHRAPQAPIQPQPAPTQLPAPTSWNPQPARHFHFNNDVALDASQVIDLR